MPKGSQKRARPVIEPPTPTPLPAWRVRLDQWSGGPVPFIAASLALLVPCFWQARLQAGDLSSHIYNAWLAQLIRQHQAPGLAISFQATNVLFDLILSAFLSLFGAAAAQRIAVSIAVLVFAWGAFAFTSAVSGRRAWSLLPSIAVLSYGWVFHMGFFNFYLSLGLCLWALALAWHPVPRRLASAAILIAIAWVAHPLPVAWALSTRAYFWIARRVRPERQWRLAGAGVAAIIAIAAILRFTTDARWADDQVTMITGLDQVRVFGEKYWIIYIGLLLVWGSAIVRIIRDSGVRALTSSLLFQVCVLGAAGILIVPNWVQLPGYRHALAFISERMSLPVAILICALLAAAKTRALERFASVAVALLFFGFLYADESVLNTLEDSMTAAVSRLPPGQRVISGVDDPYTRVDPIPHMIDRACLGHCYSYANYEPSTGQFRIRAIAPNPVVISDYDDSWKMQNGLYVVQPRDLPLYQVLLDGAGHAFVRPLQTGTRAGMTYWNGIGNTSRPD